MRREQAAELLIVKTGGRLHIVATRFGRVKVNPVSVRTENATIPQVV
jgi:hypothetical protein